MKTKNIFLYIVFFLLFVKINAQNNEAIFDNAVQAYNLGEYDKAILLFTQITENQQESAALYYNLGNAYYKKGEIAPSIYYLEKALKLTPNDSDIQNNLELAQRMKINQWVETPKNWAEKWIEKISNLFSLEHWTIQTIIFSSLFSVFFLGFYFNRKTFWKRLLFSLSILSILISTGSFIISYDINRKSKETYAIVFEKKIQIYSEPNTFSTEIFSLQEGDKLQVVNELNQWIKIQLSDGRNGWTKTDFVKKL